MSASQTFAYGLLLLLVFLAYQEFPDAFALAWLRIRLHALNAFMFVKAWLLYRELSKKASKLGLAFPPFRFTPLWERD